MSGPELKPCPFCGGEAVRQTLPSDEFGNDGGDVIECEKCLASSHVEFGRKENLVSAWNTRDPAVLAALPEVQAIILESCDRFRRNLRETFDAMCAMRDTINEHIPMPSLESDLLQGPENSVFCATVAKSVIGAIAARDAMIAAERDACIAECQLRAAKHEGDGRHEMMREAELCGDAIRKRGNV